MNKPTILFHILVKDKAKVLDYWLEQNLDNINYPKENIILYIRTNNNTDNSKEILENWINHQKSNNIKWKEIIYDDLDINKNIEQYGIHEWNEVRIEVIAKLRQEGISKAIQLSTDFYFVCDVDNFLIPDTLSKLVALNLPVISPLLRYAYTKNEEKIIKYANNNYSNFHHPVDKNGYFISSTEYYQILNREKPGIHMVDLVHCTYLINKEVLNKISYFDGSKSHEYIIIARNLRLSNIAQYIDNRTIYGYLTLTENKDACKEYMKNLLNNNI